MMEVRRMIIKNPEIDLLKFTARAAEISKMQITCGHFVRVQHQLKGGLQEL
jgi:hypothetical protein